MELRPVKLNLTGEYGDPTAKKAGEKLLTHDTLDLIEQRNAADLFVYDHALARAELDGRTRRYRDAAYAHQLVRLGDLVGSSAARASEQADLITAMRAEMGKQERHIHS